MIFIARTFLSAAVALVSSPLALSTEPQKNILLIMSDDLRDYGGVFTREHVKTPNLDRLRQKGVTFERAYVQYTICNPSRTSMLTGLRCEQTGVISNKLFFREKLPNIVTMPQYFRQQGWHAAAYGKIFHLGGGEDRTLWMDLKNSWDVAKAFEATPEGRIVEGRNVTDDALSWCRWGMTTGTDDDQPDGQTASAVVKQMEENKAANRFSNSSLQRTELTLNGQGIAMFLQKFDSLINRASFL